MDKVKEILNKQISEYCSETISIEKFDSQFTFTDFSEEAWSALPENHQSFYYDVQQDIIDFTDDEPSVEDKENGIMNRTESIIGIKNLIRKYNIEDLKSLLGN